MFTIYSDSSSDSTMVSNLFIDEYMKSANDAQIKIYLYLLRVVSAHRPTSVSDLADQFNHTEKDVIRSLRYWEQKGLLNLTFRRDGSSSDEDLVSVCLRRPEESCVQAGREHHVLPFSTSPREGEEALSIRQSLPLVSGGVLPAGTGPAAGAVSVSADRSAVMAACSSASGSAPGSAPQKEQSELEALESFRNDASRAQLLFVIEQYIGKPLSLNEIRVIYNIAENLHFSNDLIDYLFQYCVDRGKKDFRYIRAVADNWAAEGVMTPTQAEALQPAPDTAKSGRKRSRRAAAPVANPSSLSDPGPAAENKAASGSAGRRRSSNSFNQFEQNSYDFDALEEELLHSSVQ